MASSEFVITPEKLDKITSAFSSQVPDGGISREQVDSIHKKFKELKDKLKGQYLAHITRVMENYLRDVTGNPLFIIKYTPFAIHEKMCSAAFYPGKRFVIFYPPDMPEKKLRVQLAHELGHLFILSLKDHFKDDLWLPTYHGTTEPVSSIFGLFTISDKNDFYSNALDSGRNHENWEAILSDFLELLQRR